MTASALVLIALTAIPSGSYCGTDVPYDVRVDGAQMFIDGGQSSTDECKLDGSEAKCDSGTEMTVTFGNDAVTLNWPGLSMPVVLPVCSDAG